MLNTATATNGELLAIYQAERDTPAGYGLVKLSKDSKLLWKYDGRVHHDLDVDEHGTIFTLTERVALKAPTGLDYLPTPFVAESLVVLSPDGLEVARIPIEIAFRDSPYSSLMAASIGEQEVPDDRGGTRTPLESAVKPGAKGDLRNAVLDGCIRRWDLGLGLVDFPFDRPFELFGGFLELGQPFSDRFSDLRKLLGPKDQQGHDEDQNQFGHSERAEHVSSSAWILRRLGRSTTTFAPAMSE